MYIAGTHSRKDVYDDVTKVPNWGDLRDSTRYKATEKALKDNPQTNRVIGHSPGGQASLELQTNYPDQKV